MSETIERNIQEADIEISIDATSDSGVGALLSETRITQGLSQEFVAESLKISVAYVDALETGNYGVLPGAAFARGYLRSYARLLELDENRILSICRNEMAVDDHVVRRILREKPLQRLNPPSHRSLAIVFGVIVLVFLLGSILWWKGRDNAVTTAPVEHSDVYSGERTATEASAIPEVTSSDEVTSSEMTSAEATTPPSDPAQ